ncbi:AAA family ATPase [Psychrobacter arenosus]|uniref:AAA family ATPase n=1 Tax=Psychrobacter arenosus TaxID=256326 RepID=UPI00191970C8|nr:AAA family ATPase [Psychrobacter arenosus]
MTIKPIQKIIFGSPGTGKSYMIDNVIIPHELGINEESVNRGNVIKAVFHPEYTHGDFMGKLLPITRDKDVEYRFYEGHFLKAIAKAYKNILSSYDNKGEKISDPDNVVLVIDEINRGNSSAIFGSVFQLLDRDVEGWSSYNTNVNGVMFDSLYSLIGGTYYKNNDKYKYILAPFDTSGGVLLETLNNKVKPILNFDLVNRNIKIPPNLSIIATMNTSDSSIYYMDTAFKRRWDWEFIDIDSNRVKADGTAFSNRKEWNDFIKNLNDFIKSNHKSIRGIEDKQIGNYFIQGSPVTNSEIQSKVMFFIWDSVFSRDKAPLRDLLQLGNDSLVTFGDFAKHVVVFIEAINNRNV